MPLVQISLLSGRTKEQKREIAKDVTEVVSKHSGASKEAIIVVFHDVERDSWAAGGTLYADK